MKWLVQEVVQNTRIDFEQAERAVDVVIHHLERRLPDPFPELMVQVLEGKNFRQSASARHRDRGGQAQPTLHLTGMSKAEFEEAVRTDTLRAQCVVCGRSHGEEVIAFNEEANPVIIQVEIMKYHKKCGDDIAVFSICKIHAHLLGLFSTGDG